MKKIDFKKSLRDLYHATRKIGEVTAPKGTFIAVDGKGEPGNEGYHHAIAKLYGVAYTTKFTLKNAGVIDFNVPNLECLWFDDPAETPRSAWRWRLLLRIPDQVTVKAIADAKRELANKRGTDTSGVKRMTWAEGHALQVTHVGPYDKLSDTYAAIAAYAAANEMGAKGPGHEIYLNDPRRVAPAKLKTIVRMPVRRSRGSTGAHPRLASATRTARGRHRRQ